MNINVIHCEVKLSKQQKKASAKAIYKICGLVWLISLYPLFQFI